MVNLLNVDSINGNERNDNFFTALNTWIIIVQTPCLDVVLGQLSVSQQLYGVWHQLYIVLGKLLKLQVHPANLEQQTYSVLPKKATKDQHTPGYQKDNSEANKYSGMFCCVSG